MIKKEKYIFFLNKVLVHLNFTALLLLSLKHKFVEIFNFHMMN
jgi:hypothetical protein